MACAGLAVRLPLVLLAALVCATGGAQAVTIDGEASRVGFTMKTRWGQTLEGRFETLLGDIIGSDDGLTRVNLRMPTRGVEIVGHPRYTRVTRSESFFDSNRFPFLEFQSDPHPESLAHEGGKLGGFLTIRGVRRREVLTVLPATCARPGLDCDVVVTGVVYRGDYDMGNWSVALSDRVQLQLHIRVREP